MKEKIISKNDLSFWVKTLIDDKYRVVSYDQNEGGYKAISAIKEFNLDPSNAPSKLSVKGFIFPQTGPILFYQKKKNEIKIIDPQTTDGKTVLFGVKPCDTKAIDTLSKVFNWDYKDSFFNEKMENTIVIGLKCNYSDEFCFCESVKSAPDCSDGSDIFLTISGDDSYHVQIITEKGEKFISHYGNNFKDLSEQAKSPERSNQQKIIDSVLIREWLNKNFDNPVWDKIGETCLGCGNCAFICPTCHCFDIVDEEYSFSEGRRMKNWDACQFNKFTLHASGHNPRDNQQKRYRQRVSHKFKYYYDKFDEILCTGCGRCSRECPVGISISQVLEEIETLAKNK
jgi:ferredoxin